MKNSIDTVKNGFYSIRKYCYEGKTLYGQGKPQQTGMTAEIYSIPTYAI